MSSQCLKETQNFLMTDFQKKWKMITTSSNLPTCPCCHSMASIVIWDSQHDNGDVVNNVMITCSKDGCRQVWSHSMDDAVRLWKQPRFTDKLHEHSA